MPRDPREELPLLDDPLLPGPLAERLSRWLIHEARLLPDNPTVLTEFCERVYAAGVPIDRVSLHQRAFHPQYRGVSRIWRPNAPLEEKFLDHGIEKTATYIESPVRIAIEENRSLDWRLDGNNLLPYAVLSDLRETGYTHHHIAPLVYAAGAVNSLAWATKRPGGFSAADMQVFEEVLPAFAAIAEVKAMRRFIGSVLTTYVGEEAGRLILDGQVRRGDVREITAALMLIDLPDFTTMSDRLSSRAVIRILNQYFDCVMAPIREHGGEVVEIMGDGVLAIFDRGRGGGAAEACGAALTAANAGPVALADGNRRAPA